jgi:cytochrome c peroxidase
VDLLRSSPEYVERFQQAFGRLPDRNGIANAIATFERAQFAGDSRVDLYEAGDLDQLTASEERGRALFHGEARCATCHGGSNYSDEQLHNIGLIGGNDLGGFFTSGGRNKNARAFKTPTLRNIDVTGPYFHNGSVETLEEVVSLYNAGPTVAGADWEARALGLTADEETDLVAFLRALTSPNATTPMDVELPEIPE